MGIKELEVQLEELYNALGKAYYEIGINDPLPELEEQLNAVSACREEIEKTAKAEEEKKAFLEKQKKIAKSICLECGLSVPAGSNFCNHCGKPMPGAEMVEAAVKALAEAASEEGTPAKEPADVPAQRFCKICGHILLPKHKFCPGCGTPAVQC